MTAPRRPTASSHLQERRKEKGKTGARDRSRQNITRHHLKPLKPSRRCQPSPHASQLSSPWVSSFFFLFSPPFSSFLLPPDFVFFLVTFYVHRQAFGPTLDQYATSYFFSLLPSPSFSFAALFLYVLITLQRRRRARITHQPLRSPLVCQSHFSLFHSTNRRTSTLVTHWTTRRPLASTPSHLQLFPCVFSPSGGCVRPAFFFNGQGILTNG